MNNEYENKLKTFNSDQRPLYDEMQINNKLNMCSPTGFGKGYIMGIDLFNRVVNKKEHIIAVATHRLILNTQHMNDIIEQLKNHLNDVKLVFVGSKDYKVKKSVKDIIRLNKLTEKELIKNVSSKKELNKIIKKYHNKTIILITTYHSLDKLSDLDIDTLYCDEAHILATAMDSDSDKNFRNNFNKLTFKNCYFFTATPKDCVNEETGDFLMNNEIIFGKRIGITIKQAIEGSYIPKPIIHIAIPTNYENTDMENLTNLIFFIKDSYVAHSNMILKESNLPKELGTKLLIKCKNVDQMWALNERLLNEFTNVKIFAGASRKDDGGEEYQIDGIEYSKDEHLEELQLMKNNENAIVLHVDTLSEGVNVPGFTGVMFLSDMPPTLMKLLQNMGRGTRLHPKDRVAIMNNYIDSSDYSKWIKPYTFIILPIYNTESEESQKHIATSIFNLRDKGVDSVYRISIGSDILKSNKKPPVPINDENEIGDPRKKVVTNINHQIEKLENIREDVKYFSMTDEEKINDLFN